MVIIFRRPPQPQKKHPGKPTASITLNSERECFPPKIGNKATMSSLLFSPELAALAGTRREEKEKQGMRSGRKK